MDNSYLMSFSDVSNALGGRLIAGEGNQANELASGGFLSVSIDSREVVPGALFVALRGSAQDGHRFIDAAFSAGAYGALVDNAALEDLSLGLSSLVKKWNRVFVAVEDTLKGLQNAARAYLKQFSGLLRIGITGSTGKTTTKEIAAAIIGQEKSVIMNKGNFNSETGLPLSVFNVRSHHEVGIFEAGMNRRGEIAELAKVLNPHIALITNIGSAHIGILGSMQAIAEEKKKIFSEFTGDNIALIPAEDEYRDFLADGVNGKKVFYGPNGLLGLYGVKDLGLEGTEIDWEGEKARFGLPGKFNLSNALAAIALALELPVSASSIRRGLETVKPLFGRGEILHGRATLIRDCYNSNPVSAEAAIDFCDGLECSGRKIYVIGSMLELGGASVEAHAALGRRLASCSASMLFLFGEEMRYAADVHDGAKNIPFFYTCDMVELSRELDAYIKDGDIVLLKGSRGCMLESLTDICIEKKISELNKSCVLAEGGHIVS